MNKKPSKRREERYLVLRCLYWQPRFFKSLITSTDFEVLIITRALGTLIANGDVIKKKIYVEKMTEEEISEFRIGMGVLHIEPKTKHQFTHLYTMTKKGEKKLAFWEFRFGYYETIQPVNEGKLLQDKYRRKMAEFFPKQSFMKKKKSG